MTNPFNYPVDTGADGTEYISTWRRTTTGNLLPTRTTLSDAKVIPTGGSAATLASLLATAKAVTDVIGATDVELIDQDDNATSIGAKADPAAGTVTCSIARTGAFFTLTFTLTAARITVTDGAGAGSFGALKIFDFAAGAVSFLGARQDYTAFAEGAALTGGAGDASFEIGVGTTAISAAADGTLGNGVNENVGQAVAVTLSGGTGTGTAVDGAKTTALNGTATAIDLYLNWSGTAATIDATSTIDVTGTITVAGVMLGDD